MRYWQAILPVAAAAAVTPAFGADPSVYVLVGYTDNMAVVVEVEGGVPLRAARTMARASQITHYAMPSFDFEGVPVRRTETQFEIDCRNRQSRRLSAAAYRDGGARLGGESYSEEWASFDPDSPMAKISRLACNGLGPDDAVYTNLASAIGAHGKLVADSRAE